MHIAPGTFLRANVSLQLSPQMPARTFHRPLLNATRSRILQTAAPSKYSVKRWDVLGPKGCTDDDPDLLRCPSFLAQPHYTASSSSHSTTASARFSATSLISSCSHQPSASPSTTFSTVRTSCHPSSLRLFNSVAYHSTQRRVASVLQRASPLKSLTQRKVSLSSPSRLPYAMSTKQAPHPTVLIPGPIEYDDAVLQSMGHFSQSHVGQPFVDVFGETLSMLRKLFITSNPNSQPFVLSGSGTLGWDQVAANLTEHGDDVLVLHTGYFADSFADCFSTYGANPTQLKAPIGGRPQLPEIERELKQKKYKVVTITHVDTSTGVLSELEKFAQLVRRVSPETLIVVDGVCSVGAEPLYFDKWDLDVVLTASQKAIGCPAGLSIVMASERAMRAFDARKSRPASYFASWKNWRHIMQNYEAKKPSYFATPSPQLIHALHTSLTQILAVPLEQRFEQHKKVSRRVKHKVAELGLKQLALADEDAASTMTAIWLPEGVAASDFLPGMLQRGVVFAGGLHKEVATKYIRFGHMGVSVMDEKREDVDKALQALEQRLAEVKKS